MDRRICVPFARAITNRPFAGLALALLASASLLAAPAWGQSAPAPGQQVVLVTGSTGGLGEEVALGHPGGPRVAQRC